jgi:uncharacterized protein (DUF2141 family)
VLTSEKEVTKMNMKSWKTVTVALAIVVLTVTILSSSFIGKVWADPDVARYTNNNTDVDWDGVANNRLAIVINDGTSYQASGNWYDRVSLWNAPFIIATSNVRVFTGINSLREQVYWRESTTYSKVRRLDEGWWDQNGEKQGYLYQSKVTTAPPGKIQTIWTSFWSANGINYQVILNRTIYVVGVQAPVFAAAIVEYNITFVVNGIPNLAGQVGFGVLWRSQAGAGNAAQSLAATVSAMATLQVMMQGYHWQGIKDEALTFEVSYSFDDSMKEWSNTLFPQACLIGWDGATCLDFASWGYDYQDAGFSPLTAIPPWQPSPAILGMVHIPALFWYTSIKMENGFFNSTGQWVGVGPTGREAQKVYVTYSPPVSMFPDVNGDGKVDVIDILIVAKNFGNHRGP